MRGKNGNADENDNLDFIQEEIAPGKVSLTLLMKLFKISKN